MRKGLLFIFALLSAAAFAVEWEDVTRLRRIFLIRLPMRLISETKTLPRTK